MNKTLALYSNNIPRLFAVTIALLFSEDRYNRNELSSCTLISDRYFLKTKKISVQR